MPDDGFVRDITIRAAHDHEWRELRALRLRALRDDAADIAFVDTLEDALSRPDEFWEQRAAMAPPEAPSDGVARQFVALTNDGTWIGATTVIAQRQGETDHRGREIRVSGGILVGIYVDPDYRGRRIADALIESALEWIREQRLGRAVLFVHADNVRARRAYERAGFLPTGVTSTGPIGPEIEMARDA